jgi:uncharacterized membrane protein
MVHFFERFLAYGALGWCLEVLFTGVSAVLFRHDRSATGQTYLWMLPIYGGAGLLLETLHHLLVSAGVGFGLRLVAYVVVIYAVEAVSGHTLRRLLGRCPWDYGDARFGVRGLVRLDYAPFWALVGLLFEPVQSVLSTLSRLPSA